MTDPSGVFITQREIYDTMVKLTGAVTDLRADMREGRTAAVQLQEQAGRMDARITALERWKGTVMTVGGGGGLAGIVTAVWQALHGG